MSKRIILSISLLIITGTCLALLGSLGWYAFVPAQSGSKENTIIEVHRGDSPSAVSKELASQGIVASSKYFQWVGRITRQWGKLKTGEYRVSPSMSAIEIFATITSGISVARPITIREGENIYEIAQHFEDKGLSTKAEFLRRCKNPRYIQALKLLNPAPSTLEGYLFPDTYFFNKTLTIDDMIRQMIKRFLSVWGTAEEARAQILGLSRHQVVTLASIIEKETGVPYERPMISSVFHNRLKKRMRLQSDPTTIYGIWEEYSGNIRKEDLQRRNPYNTYTVTALPIGPIANPGKESIQAALNPERSEFLFFVSHNDGTHEFTRTFNEHSQAVKKFQVNRKAREGKSWRDFSKKQQTPQNDLPQ